jgi:hypothetical protein
LFDTIGIYHCKIYKILAYYINHIGIKSSAENFSRILRLIGA